MNKFWVSVGEWCEFLAYMVIAFLVIVSWTGLMAVVGVVLRPEFPEFARLVSICMAMLQLIGIVYFGIKVGSKKKEWFK